MIRYLVNAKPDEFESTLDALGLNYERIALKTKPNAVHWHIRKPREKGTLEATFEQGQLYLEVRSNRMAEWIMPVIESISTNRAAPDVT